MIKINADSRIKDIIEQYPETIQVFIDNGFGEYTEKNSFEELGAMLILKTVLKVKGINQELFIKMLEEKISEQSSIKEAEDKDPEQKLNFIGYTYCPLKHTFREHFEGVLKKYHIDTGDTDFKYFVPSGCGSDDPYEDLWKAESIHQLPEIIASVGFGDFFRKEFVDRFVNKGYFKTVSCIEVDESFTSAGIIAPDCGYTIYSVFPLVMLIDIKKLGKLPVPKTWRDLLNPIYANNIITGASHGDIHEDILLHIYKDYGKEGLAKFAANIKTGWHASQMAKAAGTNNTDGAAIYIIPWMFAKSCPRTDNTLIIWPEDGAVVTPIYMLVKEIAFKKYKPFIDFLACSDYGKKSADNYFPVMSAQIDNKLPRGARFKWLGWDYIKSHSMDGLKAHVLDIFNSNLMKENDVMEMIL